MFKMNDEEIREEINIIDDIISYLRGATTVIIQIKNNERMPSEKTFIIKQKFPLIVSFGKQLKNLIEEMHKMEKNNV